MSLFAPPGFYTCEDAIGRLLEEMPADRARKVDRRARAVTELQRRLYSGELVAACGLKTRIAFFEPHHWAGTEGRNELERGKAVPLDPGVPPMGGFDLIVCSPEKAEEEKAKQAHDAEAAADRPEAEGPKARAIGAPITGRDAAIVYLTLFPKNHTATGIRWPAALQKMNTVLTSLGLPRVEDKQTVRTHVKKLIPDFDWDKHEQTEE